MTRASNKGTNYPGILGVNVGKNKMTDDPVGDFVKGVEALGEFADYIVINVSSPNTPGLRKMQGKEELKELISRVSLPFGIVIKIYIKQLIYIYKACFPYSCWRYLVVFLNLSKISASTWKHRGKFSATFKDHQRQNTSLPKHQHWTHKKTD